MRPEPTSAGRIGRLVAAARRRSGLLGYALFTVLAFFVALLWSLPHDLIATRAVDTALAAAPVGITFRSVRFAFPNGYRFTDVRVTPADRGEALASLGELTVRLPLAAILTGDLRQAAFSGRAYGGRFSGRVAVSGASVSGELDAHDVSLEPALAPFVPPPGRIGGVAAVSLRLAGDGRTTQSSEGAVELSIVELALDQVSVRGIRVPDLSFPKVAGEAQVFGTRLQLKEFRAAGPDLSLAASGDVLLREPTPQSVLNLRLTIDVPPGAQPGLRVATALLPKRSPGQDPGYTLKGTIAAPVLR
jgi:type II secretion system protein N